MSAAKWWWLPGTLLTLSAIVFLVGALWGHAGLFVPLGVVFLIIAGMNLRRRAPTR
jgi:hypothetical protein